MAEKIFCPALKKTGSKKKRAEIFSKSIASLYPDAPCGLLHNNSAFRLLVMARLSAQCTDKRVNEVSKTLFEHFPTPESFAEAPLEKIENEIHSCGLYKTKAKSIKEMCEVLVRDYNGEVPSNKEALLSLSGVGIKIANLIMGDIFSDPYIVPDTHCMRISNRVGLISKPEPNVCIRELDKLINKEDRAEFCHRIVLFGREYCKAQSPKCDTCPLNKFKDEL